MLTYNQARDEYVARMVAEGNSVHYPGPCDLQIDIDDKTHLAAFEKSFLILRRDILDESGFDLREHLVLTVSKSGRGFHARVVLPFPLDDVSRIAYQAALGSDPVRELLSLTRVRRGDSFPTLLVEGPDFPQPAEGINV